MICPQSLTKLQRILLWSYFKKQVAILFHWKKGLALFCCGCYLLSGGLGLSVRSPSRSSGHTVAVQRCVQCCTAQYSAVQCGIFAGVSVLSVSPL